jgi:hypothetical protein
MFLGAFAKLRNATIDFVMSVRPFVCPPAWNNSAATGCNFMKFDMNIFGKSIEKIQVSFKSDKNKLYFT